ncbi:MAG: alpha/beta fold hydrolase [Streptomycetales bacterium]
MSDEFEPYRSTVSGEIGEISYIDVGDGPITLFVHGVFTNGQLWRNCVRRLSSHRRCIAVDLPGHGHTPAIGDASVWGLAEAVATVIKALDLSEIHLVGNDTGGAVCQVVLARDPDRFASLALTNCDTEGNFPPPLFKPVVSLARLGMLRILRPLLKVPRVARQIYRTGYQDRGAVPLDVVVGYLGPVIGSRSGTRFMERLLSSMSPDVLARIRPWIRPELSNCHIPTAIVWGTGDLFFTLKWAHWLQRLIPGAGEVVQIPGGRLFFVDERAEELVAELEKHWK